MNVASCQEVSLPVEEIRRYKVFFPDEILHAYKVFIVHDTSTDWADGKLGVKVDESCSFQSQCL